MRFQLVCIQNCQLTISFVQRNFIYMTLRSECRGKTLRDRREIHLPKVTDPLSASLPLNLQEQRIGTSYLMNYELVA